MKCWKFGSSPNSNVIATGAYSILIYDIEKKQTIKEVDNRSKYCYALKFISDNIIAVGNSNGSIGIYNIDTHKFTNKIEEHCLTVRALEYNKNNNQLYSASDDLHINIIDANKFKVVSPMVGHKDNISTLVYNEDKNLLFSGSFDGCIKVWDPRANAKNIATLSESKGNMIWDVAVNKEGNCVVYCGEEMIGAYIIS